MVRGKKRPSSSQSHNYERPRKRPAAVVDPSAQDVHLKATSYAVMGVQGTNQDPQPLTLSQTVTTPTITKNTARPILNTVDAHAYLDLVENRFRERPEVYTQFLDIMEEFDKT